MMLAIAKSMEVLTLCVYGAQSYINIFFLIWFNPISYDLIISYYILKLQKFGNFLLYLKNFSGKTIHSVAISYDEWPKIEEVVADA